LFEENLKPEDFPTFSAFIEETALQKVLEVSNRLAPTSPTMIIGADTMVTLDKNYYGKPHTPEKAFEMLSE
jgi:predicted house-cleaning NTP pyrophosphatase (Maf/HAM1 superfamily)